jgi:hypothetical protein
MAIRHMTRSGASCSILQFLQLTQAGVTVCHRKLAHLFAQAHKYAKHRDLSAATRDFYAAIIPEGS